MTHARLIVGILIVAALGGAAWFVLPRAGGAPPSAGGSGESGATGTPGTIGAFGTPDVTSATPSAPQLPRMPAGYVGYHSAAYGFSLWYPGELAVKTYDEGGGASTITFQNTTTVEGFQIFIVPYAGTQISEERFKKDEPSGVRQGVQNVTVGGVQAVSFYSISVTLGETCEVWFIHGGYLYEVTAPKALAAWLSSIMNTWTFGIQGSTSL